ncbi:MAG: hypothetical protein ACKOBZ_05415 [Nitrospira sp.]|nr:hypothetical protein [Nitrospira sp.]
MTTDAPAPLPAWLAAVKKILLALVIGALLLAAVYLAIVFNWSYSDGDRAGYLQKISRKGWLCKTYEGELAMTTVPGTAPVIWAFTVRDEAVAGRMNALLSKKVILHYRELRFLPTACFGETPYFVDGVTAAD